METTARGDEPKTLQTIAYISVPDNADLEFLLWDLQDAIAARHCYRDKETTHGT